MLRATPLLSRRVALAIHPQRCFGPPKPSFNRLNPYYASSCGTSVFRTSPLDTTATPLDKRLSSILQFIRTKVRYATHDDYSRLGQGKGTSGWGGRRPNSDPLDSNVVFYGIIALNVGVFLAWQSAISNYVRRLSVALLRVTLFCNSVSWVMPPSWCF